MQRRVLGAVAAGVVAAAVAGAGPAAASERHGTARLDGRGPNDAATGQAVLRLDNRAGTWETSVRMRRLLPGNYDYAVQVGEDTDANGVPDTFSFHVVCSFVAGAGGVSGCAGTTTLGGRTALTPWTSAVIVDRRFPNAAFQAAGGSFK